jgi:hypothetical protein
VTHIFIFFKILIICGFLNIVSTSILKADTYKSASIDVNPFELYGDEIIFDVVREGKRVGTHVVGFQGVPNDLVVTSKFNLKIDILFINAYSFEYSSKANWKDSILHDLSVLVDDNGEKFSLEAKKRSNYLTVSNDQESFQIPLPIYPTNHWNAGVLGQNKVLNTLTGELNNVEIIEKGYEMVETGQGKVKAMRYAYTGDLETEIWYDDKKRWVGMKFVGSDGSLITYLCQKCSRVLLGK